jgi:hypothetical protein
MNTIRADDDIRLRRAAVLEFERDAHARPIDVGEPLAQMELIARHGLDEDLVQIRAMHEQIRCAVPFLRRGAKRQFEPHVAAVPVPVPPVGGLEGATADAAGDSDSAQHAHSVRAHLNSGADAGECSGLLIDLHIEPAPVQGGGCGEAAQTCADDGNARVVGHVWSSVLDELLTSHSVPA